MAVAERVIDELEAVQVDEHHRQFSALAPGLQHRQAKPVLEQHAVRQVGQDVVVGLMMDDGLGTLARADVARDAVRADIGRRVRIAFFTVHADRVK